MKRKCNTYETDVHKFIDFTDVLKNIRDSFLDDIEEFDDMGAIKLTSRVHTRFLKHSTVTETLKMYEYVDLSKTNVIIIPKMVSVDAGGLYDEALFTKRVIQIIDNSKRINPILIKKVDCEFDELSGFFESGYGEEFLLGIENDRNRLRKSICSFVEFKKYAQKEGLTYVKNNILNKLEFKKLFFS